MREKAEKLLTDLKARKEALTIQLASLNGAISTAEYILKEDVPAEANHS